ncbi:MAG: NADPH:quinone oxidoreductase family protein [Actinomycetes bacterium]
MRAVQIVDLTGPQSMRVGTVSPPVRGDGQVLIDVHAAGVAFPDLLLTRGEYQLRPDPPFIPGSEIAGEVVAVGENSRFAVGDRVAALCLLNGYAEQVSVPQDVVVALPPAMSFEAGAALPMNYLTVEFALTTRGRLEPGESVLVHGAAGGVGTAAIQFAKLSGARVIAVVSSAAKEAVAREAGADEVVPVEGFLSAVKDLTGGRGVDIVVDPVGGDRFTDSLRSLAPFGRLLVVGFTAGEIPTVKVNRLLLTNTDVVGVSWGSYALTNPASIRTQWERLYVGMSDGRLNPPLGTQYPLEQAATALLELQARRATGKTILRVRP